MINNKKQLKKVLENEKEIYKLSFFSVLGGFLFISERGVIWRYQRNLRIWEYHTNCNHKFRSMLYRIRTVRLGLKTGFRIAPNCIDTGLRIMHIGSILINSNTRIGKNCTLHINTSFVATNGDSSAPIIGDNCKFGVGCCLIGPISLKNNVVVGAGAVVNKTFDEDHITIAGVPARIVSKKAIL